MLYNSFPFLLFFPLATLLYYAVPQGKKWVYLLAVSWLFYANWNPACLLLMLWVTGVTYAAGLLFSRKSLANKRVGGGNTLLTIALLLTVAPLLGFKYLNFFTQSLWALFAACGLRMEVPLVDWLLPIGISFYTFQAMGYVIDVHQGRVEAERHLGLYATFVAFFPQTAAGPIGRAKDLLPQFRNPRGWDTAGVSCGLKWMLWGYFMKVAVADRLALYTDAVMGNVLHHTGVSVWLAAVMFSVQIYCDFAGYSLLAAGAGKVMGFDLIHNFRRPYMAQSVGDFWRRWHISLSTWFRDYLYFPLGGSRCPRWRTNLNLMITFLVSGLWHGAAWTFVFWGGLNGLFQVLERPFVRKGAEERRGLLAKAFHIALTFTLMTVAWVFFKVSTFADGFLAVQKMFCPSGTLYIPQLSTLLYCLMGMALVVAVDVWQERTGGRHPLLEARSTAVRIASIVLVTLYLLAFGVFDGGQFIYFKF